MPGTQKTIASLIAQLKLESTQWREEIKKAKNDMKGLGDDGGKLSDRLRNANKEIEASFSQLKTVAGTALAAIGVSLSVGKVYEYAESWTALNNRLKLVSTGSADLVSKQNDVIRIANNSLQSMQDVADLYSKVTQAGKTLGLSQQQVATITETVSKSIAISGGSAASAEAAILQLNQALASGVLRGEEFNSVSEQAPRLLKAIADSLGVNIGQLRAMAQEGKLTSDIVIASLESQTNTINSEFAKTKTNMGQGLTVLQNGLTTFVGRIDDATGISESLANGLVDLGKQIAAVGDTSEEAAKNSGNFTNFLKVSAEYSYKAYTEIAKIIDALGALGGMATTVDLGFGGLEKTISGIKAYEQAFSESYKKRELDQAIFLDKLNGTNNAAALMSEKQLKEHLENETRLRNEKIKNDIDTAASSLVMQHTMEIKANNEKIKKIETDNMSALDKAKAKRDEEIAFVEQWANQDTANAQRAAQAKLLIETNYQTERRRIIEASDAFKKEKQAQEDAEDQAREVAKAEHALNTMIWKMDEELRLEYERRDAKIARINEQNMTDLERLDAQHAQEMALYNEYQNRHLSEHAKNAEIKARIDANYAKQKEALEQAEALRTMRYDKMNAQNRLQMHERFGQAMIAIGGGIAGKLFKLNQGIALAQAAVALPAAVMESFKNGGGYPWGLIPAGLMLAEGLAQIATIKNQSFDSGGGGGVSVPSVGSGGNDGPYGPTPGAPLDGVSQFIDDDAKPNQNKLEVAISLLDVPTDGIFTGAQFNYFVEELNKKLDSRNLGVGR